MPKLDIVPIEEARGKTTSESAAVRKKAQILQEYRGYIDSSRVDRRAGSCLVVVRLQLP